MIDRLAAALQFDQEALNLRHQRQQVLANNIANADTPNFKARDFDFASELSRAMDSGRPAGGGERWGGQFFTKMEKQNPFHCFDISCFL